MTPEYQNILAVLDGEMQNLPKDDALRLEMDVLYRVDELEEGANNPVLVTGLLALCRPFPALLKQVRVWLQGFQWWGLGVAL